MPPRVRFAPSPTGPLHIGGVRTALYNYLFAKKHNGTFILRIEDTDQARLVAGAEQYIIDSLKWCGIEFDEGPAAGGGYGPYRQSDRKSIYRQYAEELVRNGYAYYAFDSAAELEAMRKRLKDAKASSQQYDSVSRMTMTNSLTLAPEEVKRRMDSGEPYVIRIKIPAVETVSLRDIIHGTINVHTSDLDDKVLFKSDGMPTYHLANVVDDYLMKITHVIRGDEWLPSTPLHVLLYRYLGWESSMPQFAHLPLILRPDGTGKLSKRDGDRLGFPVFPLTWKDPATGEISVGYRERGYFPEAVINFIAFLGWNPGTEQELFTMDELINAFSLEKVQKAGAKFDQEKIRWFNHQYLQKKTDDNLAKKLIPYIYEWMNFTPKTITDKNSTYLDIVNDCDNKLFIRLFANEVIPKNIKIISNITSYTIIKNQIVFSPYYIYWIHLTTREREQMFNTITIKTLNSEITYLPGEFLKVQPNVVEIENLKPFILHDESSLELEINKKETVRLTVYFEEMPIYSSPYSFDFIKNISRLMKERVFFIQEIVTEGKNLFVSPDIADLNPIKKKLKPNTVHYISELLQKLSLLPDFNPSGIDKIIHSFIEDAKLSPGEIMPVLRYLLTGKPSGPAVFEIMALLGKEEAAIRMEAGMKLIQKSI